MITTSMLRRQVWITVYDEFDYAVKNSQRVLRLNAKYESHPYVEEFTKQCNIIFVYGIYFRKILYQTTQAVFAGK